jgi:diguanylate cyclase (GGDEF)-like protein/PAS domain S-box-containing protein
VLLAMLGVFVVGTIATYQFSQSAERESNIAINAFDLHGDLRQIAGDLNLPDANRTTQVRRDVTSAITGAQQSIREIRAMGGASLPLEHAINKSQAYLKSARHALASSTSPKTLQGSVAAADAVGDLVDRAATGAEQSANRAALDGRIGGVLVLFLVVLMFASGLLWLARQRRRGAVMATRAEASAQFETMIEHSSDLFFLTSDDDRTQYCSPSAARFFGMSAAEVCAAPLERLVHPDDLERASDAMATVHVTGAVGPLDLRVRHGDGGWRTLEVTANDLSSVSTVRAVAWHTRDVTDRRALEEQLARQAFEDSLTGLANRALFRDRLGHALARGARTHASVAVLMIDLDGFKAINDSMGHDAGDDALKEIAARVARSARPGDTIARLGGDEFAVLLEGLGEFSFADEVANRILDLVRQPFVIQETSVRVSASIGIAVSGTAEGTPESLLRDADIAMYAAKTSGRDRCRRFEPAMHARATQQLRFSQDLAHALERRELVVYYQPSIELAGARLEGVEALLRWRHHEFGLVMPDLFIPVAEQTGLIVPIGRWVLEQACEQAVAWRAELKPEDPFVMEVNISGRQLNHESLIPDVRSILANSGLAPENLVLEITESVLMSDVDLVVGRLRELKELGVSIAIDDFGTGYSSLAYLRQLPIDILKIDRTFVDAASAGDPGGDAILRAILDLSAGLHLKTIAEGVEEVSQARHVKDLGCQSAQGYLYARPMPPEELSIRFTGNAWGSPVTPEP